MKFRNPWIDPRILQVRPEAVQTYLLSHGWLYLGPALMPDMLMFDTPQPRDDKPNVILPLQLEHGSQVQRLIELIAEVALYEDRYAGDVLTDMLRQPIEPLAVNELGVSLPIEPTPK
jgi:hypothetical protein